MTQRPWHPRDARLLLALREALVERDAAPASIRRAGYEAYAWRTVDKDLAELLYDSRAEADTPGAPASGVLVRAGDDEAVLRSMSLAGAHVSVELELRPDRLLGQITPALVNSLVVDHRSPAGEPSRIVPVDELGCFVVRPMPTVPFRLRIEGPVPTVTPWITP